METDPMKLTLAELQEHMKEIKAMQRSKKVGVKQEEVELILIEDDVKQEMEEVKEEVEQEEMKEEVEQVEPSGTDEKERRLDDEEINALQLFYLEEKDRHLDELKKSVSPEKVEVEQEEGGPGAYVVQEESYADQEQEYYADPRYGVDQKEQEYYADQNGDGAGAEEQEEAGEEEQEQSVQAAEVSKDEYQSVLENLKEQEEEEEKAREEAEEEKAREEKAKLFEDSKGRGVRRQQRRYGSEGWNHKAPPPGRQNFGCIFVTKIHMHIHICICYTIHNTYNT